jgi:glycosyltransferase involved in cell wall biosynthesis
MRIAVDARELCGRPTGVGRYLSELLAEWTDDAEAGRHRWTLYAHQPAHVGAAWKERIRIVGAGSGGTAWEQWTLPGALARDRPDVLFAPGYTAPITTPAPTVVTIHDISYFAHPEWFSFREGLRRRLLTGWSARRAKVVLTDSEFSRREIEKHLSLGAARVRVIPLGMRTTSRPGAATPTRGDAALAPAPEPEADREPIVLYVGSVFERRRVDVLIAAFDAVADRVPGAQLHIVGENRTARPRLDLETLRQQSAHGGRIHIRSYVDDETLAGLYARASVFVFLSEYEGFGLTPLEALAAGVPPVLLDTPIARETNGEAARYVPAEATHAPLVEAIVECLTSRAARQDVLRHAPGVLDRYQWRRTATATLTAIAEAAGAG